MNLDTKNLKKIAMKYHNFFIWLYLLFTLNINLPVYATQVDEAAIQSRQDNLNFKEECLQDLEFFRERIRHDSAPFANKEDKAFKEWFDKGYILTKELISGFHEKMHCYYAMRYYLNGFANPYIGLRGYTKLPKEQYPGIISALINGEHIVIYKHPSVKYLSNINIGDQITQINDLTIEEYYKEYLLPFYSNDRSDISLTTASAYALILDGNPYKPLPKTITYLHLGETKTLELKYTEITPTALKALNKIIHAAAGASKKFDVEIINNVGVWVKIPSFFPSESEEVFYTGMLSSLKSLASKHDYIVFDVRGNRGGRAKWARPILRNLWGDEFIKSLEDKHIYNNVWRKKIRVSDDNLIEFKNSHELTDVKAYSKALTNKENFYIEKFKIFNENLNLFTNNDSAPFRAKIFVLVDGFCRSTCWSFVNEMTQMPGVEFIGTSTSIQSIYSYARKVKSKSENFDFFFPTQIRLFPSAKIGTSLLPREIYSGDLTDEMVWQDWTLSIIKKQLQ